MYLIERNAIDIDDIIDYNYAIIICYHINTNAKYPFLEFMMEKIPYCNNIVEEQFILPYLDGNLNDAKQRTLNKIKIALNEIVEKSEIDKITEDNCKGCLIEGSRVFMLVNITNININKIKLNRQSLTWFLLPSEIINNKSVFNINVDIDAVNIFTKTPQLGLLYNENTNKPYILPDVAYTFDNLSDSEFKSVFGNIKKKLYKCREYYYFYRDYVTAIKNDYVNRYAVFVEGKLFLESNYEFSLKDRIIDSLYPEPCIIICYTNEHCNSEDLLVKSNDSFVSLSYHCFDSIIKI